MARYNHLIAASRDDRQPTQWACLDCEATAVVHPRDPRREISTLVNWVVCGRSGRAGVYGPEVWREGEDQESFWAALASRLAHGGALWLVGAGMCRLLSLVGLWGRLEDGTACLAGEDCRGTTDRRVCGVPGVRGDGRATDRPARDDGGTGMPGLRGVHRADGAPDCRGRRGRKPPHLGAAVLEDPPTVLRVRLPGRPGTLICVDSRNYGVEAPPGPSSARSRAKRLATWMSAALSTLSTEGLGAWRATAASQGWHAWRRAHQTHMVQAHVGPRALRLEEDAYHGGRCECHRLGGIPGPVFHLDVRSMYPWCCVGHPLPSGVLGCAECPADVQARRLCAAHLCIAEVTIASPEPAYPWRHQALGLTVWPTGRYRTCLCGPELADALRLDRVRRWHRIAWYEGAPFLSAWASHLLALREAHRDDPCMTAWLKTLLVGGIGRLGARERRWEDAPCQLLCRPWDAFTIPRPDGTRERWRCLAGRTQRQVVGGFSPDAVPAAAAWITSLARTRLLSIVRCAGWKHVVYCDTDSVFVDAQGRDRLSCYGWIDPVRVGYLKEVCVYASLKVRGVKWYETERSEVAAGRGPGAPAGEGVGPLYWAGVGPAGGLRAARRPDADRRAVPHARDVLYRHGRRTRCGRVVPLDIKED